MTLVSKVQEGELESELHTYSSDEIKASSKVLMDVLNKATTGGDLRVKCDALNALGMIATGMVILRGHFGTPAVYVETAAREILELVNEQAGVQEQDRLYSSIAKRFTQ